jgi:NAD(P)-dependent dehydrogenase (short-subunit alcohol dehydrogenase family)
MIKFDFIDKIVLVTGSSRGIGKACAIKFAEAGASVVVHYNKNRQLAEKVLEFMPECNHFLVQADLTVAQEVSDLANKVFEKFGRVDVLINNAGVFEEFDVLSLSFEAWQQSWEKTIKTNLTGAANLSFLIAKKMKDEGGCRIVNVSSRGAFRGEPDAPAYGASKAGMNSFGQSFAKAFAKYNIYVYTIAPGFVATEMAEYAMIGERSEEIRNQSPLSRIASPDEIAQTILFLASPGTEYMTGCIVDMNGASYLRT